MNDLMVGLRHNEQMGRKIEQNILPTSNMKRPRQRKRGMVSFLMLISVTFDPAFSFFRKVEVKSRDLLVIDYNQDWG